MPGSGDTAVSPRAVQERQTLQSAVQRRPERVMRTRSARARDTACQQDESPWNVHPGTPESSWSQAGCQKHPPRRWLWPGWEALPRPRRQQYSRLGQACVQGRHGTCGSVRPEWQARPSRWGLSGVTACLLCCPGEHEFLAKPQARNDREVYSVLCISTSWSTPAFLRC